MPETFEGKGNVRKVVIFRTIVRDRRRRPPPVDKKNLSDTIGAISGGSVGPNLKQPRSLRVGRSEDKTKLHTEIHDRCALPTHGKQKQMEPVEVGKAVWKSVYNKTDQEAEQPPPDRTALLQECESILERGRRTKASFMEQGEALLKIRSERLYKDKHYTSFDTYCHEEWGFTRQRACDLIKAFESVKELPPGVEKPKNERHARKLRRQQQNGGSEGKPEAKEDPKPRTEKEELFSKIEKLSMALIIELRKLTEADDRRAGYRKLDPIIDWVRTVEPEAI